VGDDGFALTLGDGRRLEGWANGGSGTGALLLHVGTPMAGLPHAPFVAAASGHGLRFVTYSRPGYGTSTPHAGRVVADCVADVTAVAAELGLERLHVVGWSGGGPHALATAALAPELVASAATLAGVAPWDAPGLEWLDGMADENVEEFDAARRGTEAMTAFLEDAAAGLGDQTGRTLAEALGGLVTEVDRRALAGSGELADYLADSTRHAVSQGIAGWRDDDLAFTRDWGFQLGAIRVPVTVWQGRQDAMVPYAHGDWLARHVPGAQARLFEDEGHISLVERFDEVVAELVASAG
jgi:pimeloyl-ACP methyl ester carboxylesterase